MILKIFYDQKIGNYSGEELQSLWAYKKYDIQGDSCIAFLGACDVRAEHMVDVEDLKEKRKIYSEFMAHFIIEHFDVDLEKAVLRQRLFAAIAEKELRLRVGGMNSIIRKGDDLYEGDCKLTISIATVTPVSSMIHFGINVSSRNTPVKTKGLKDYGIDVDNYVLEVMKDYKEEIDSIKMAKCKVRGVK